ncbi:MAG: KUP/HAK/KT family potassium transporter [Gammaproteobacteria bacterium]|nr:KUP/HAK/KT family potassium transporter [Gammaproteobacteria bacterium]
MSEHLRKKSLAPLTLAALGIIYGDIGTSPLYALNAALHGLTFNLVNVVGLLSLILWTLVLVVSAKYLCLVLNADNEGEGGVLALLALLKEKHKHSSTLFFLIGIFGAGLMFGDGMLTPAISVMSAVEGIAVVSPAFSHWVLPASFIILFLLFSFQFLGTHKIGFLFGPLILIWFTLLGILGVIQIIKNPIVLQAINPHYAYAFFINNAWVGYAILGSVFLVVTGAEALYADLGHFGKSPVRLSWFFVVFPALYLNYSGQASYLLAHPHAANNPFYLMAPSWFLIPLIIIATIATIIASQAVISATFSMTKQAVLLGLYPRLPIRQTSEVVQGQIYVPQINFLLGLGTLILIMIFKSSDAIAHAYGIAVNLVMMLTTFMIILVAKEKWLWNPLKIILVFSIFVLIDIAFFGANVEKLSSGGWIPIMLAAVCAIVMYTWNKGMEYLQAFYFTKQDDFVKMLAQLHEQNISHLNDLTAIFITDVYDRSGGSFLRFLKLNRSIPENILILNYTVENIPYVSSIDRYEASCLDKNICQLTLHFGFMDFISVPQALYVANDRQLLPFKINIDSALYLIEVPNIIASQKKKSSMFFWQERLFTFLMRNYSANINIDFYQLPYDRTIAIGTYCVI